MSKKNKKKSRHQLKRLIRPLYWFIPGLFTGLFIPWYFYISYVVDSVVSEKWDIPSVIYARPLELYQNKPLSTQALEFELNVLGYNEVIGKPQIGQYSRAGGAFKVFTKGFHFGDNRTQAQRVQLQIVAERISHINTPLIRLEPKIIGHFFSSQLENRQPIDLLSLPDTLVRGLQAIEDRSFKQHHGIDILSILRALIKNIFAGEIVQGGSSITQQLIKNKLHYNEQNWLRKLHEALAAIILESRLSKKDILQMYFNEIYWGQDGKVAIHGILEAARYYFAKPVESLSIQEQALLVGIIKGPSWYNPFKNTQRATDRRNLVLKVWYATGVIDKQQYHLAAQSKLRLSQQKSLKTDFDDFIAVVKAQLKKQFSSQELKQRGLKIFTSLDPFVQHKVIQTARRTDLLVGKDYESAIVVSQAKSGEILAVSGSKSQHSYYNRALLAKRQIGSLIKPFVYLAGLELLPDFNMSSIIRDEKKALKTMDGKIWRPRNWDGKSLGPIKASTGLIQSRNQATVDLALKFGLKSFIKYLEKLGLNINRSAHWSLFLGAIELTPMEVENLFFIFSSRGSGQKLNAIRHISNAKGQLISRAQLQNTPNIATKNIDLINRALNEVTKTGTAKKISTLYRLPQPLFGKTGTTNQGRDSWFAGFNHQYLITVWVGRDDSQATPLTGSSGALVLWSHLFNNL
ncbi:MAG: transglycosylase domain-containing protein [Proteobacteria bacterium]|nr:transglycosylase domain-containing protein [Pseudomonadota bacterium]